VLNYKHETHALGCTFKVGGLTDLSVIAHVFYAYNLAFILIFADLELWLINIR